MPLFTAGLGSPETGSRIGASAFGRAAARPIPFHAVDGRKLSGHGYILSRRRGIVTPAGTGHFDGGSAGGIIYATDPIGLVTHQSDRRNTRVKRLDRIATAELTRNRKGTILDAGIQRKGCGGQCQRACFLTDIPLNRLSGSCAIIPLIVGSGSDVGTVLPGVRTLDGAAQSELGAVVVLQRDRSARCRCRSGSRSGWEPWR